MTSRMNEMQALINRRDEVIAKFKEVERKHNEEMKIKMAAAELALNTPLDVSPIQSVELS